VVRLAVLATGAGAIAVAVLGRLVVGPVFGQGFVAGADALPGLGLAAIFLAGWKLLVADLAGQGRPRVRLTSLAIGIAVMIAADAVLVPALGLVGASIGCAVSYLVTFVLAARSWMDDRHRWRDLLLPTAADLRDLRTLARRPTRPAVPEDPVVTRPR
jgi:O-antigen/teichoic acid export membrane protein